MYNQGLLVRAAVAITPHDTNDQGLDPATGGSPSTGIYIGGTGNLNVILEGMSSAILFSNLPVGFHPLRVKRVMATTTTATLIRALVG